MRKMIFQIFKRKFSTNSKGVALVKEVILTKPLGSVKTVKGWARSIRKMGEIVFMDVNDGSCFSSIQVVCASEIFNKSIKWGTSLHVTGTIQVTEKGQIELKASEITVVGSFNDKQTFPFTLKQKHSFDHYRQFLHFRPKIRYFASMLRFRSAASLTIYQYFNENGFTYIHTPIITSGDCEGAAETFSIRSGGQTLIDSEKKEKTSDANAFFNSPAFLTVSAQLHLEVVVRSISKVYTFNPCFRAENSKSRLHLSEFYMIEAEEAFVTHLTEILQRIEDFVKQLLSCLLSKYSEEINYMLQFNETDSKQHLKILESVVINPFTVISFSEAKNIINKNEDKIKISSKSPCTLSKEEEFFLVKHNNNNPVFIVDWPKHEKPFYMKESSENSNVVKAVDLLVPNVGELCGGSIREDNYDILKQRLIEKKTLDSLYWYLDLRKYGNVPTGGFGLGFERFLQFILNIQNIKDTIPFPRWPHSLQM